MTKIAFHHLDGRVDTVDVADGTSVMRAALISSVNGIIGECGGQAMCATCHVYVREDYLDLLPSVGDDEDEMLDCTISERDPRRSRLGCQITVTPALEGLEVDIPHSQV